ncbi:hypothetical protein A2U01_0029979 [Trifolium medium]|uniref:Uncharacterized protein n=1 Tax=Trifolium medium TaxID=97028 RepID=A0A392PB82_9FABA|nr:hypothetical protein [Trifolium medium]
MYMTWEDNWGEDYEYSPLPVVYLMSS